jgi:hypothetical protein
MKVYIYNYSGNTMWEYHIGNYAYSAGGYNSAASCICTGGASPLTVRWGNDGSYDCVWIGETSSGWSYLQVAVTEFSVGFRSATSTVNQDAWDISYVTSFGTVATSYTPSVNLASGSGVAGNAILHAGNYTSYAPSLGGSGATGTWGISITGNSDTVDGLHASSFTRKDTTGQWIKPYYEYGNYLTSESPSTMASQMSSGGGLRVDFMHPSYTGSGNWNHVITFSGYNFYNMYQLGAHYDGGTGTDLWVRSEANHGGSSWTAWRKLLNSSNYNSYSPTLTGGGASGTWSINISGSAASLQGYTWNQAGKDVRGSQIYVDNWFRNYNSGTGLYNEATANHFYSDGQYWNVAYSGTTGIRLRNGHAGTVLGYLYGETNGRFGLLNAAGSWSISLNPDDHRHVLFGGGYGDNAYNTRGGVRLLLGGGDSDARNNYYIGTNFNDYGGNYTKLDLAWHTGIRIGAQAGYGGVRFYSDEDFSSVVFSVNTGDSHVRVTNNLYVGGNLALHAGNYTSYTGGLSSTNNWSGQNYFVANRNTTSDSPALQAYSNNGSGAIMSFHRSGQYAVNFGLDSDNVMRIGGWSAAANRWQLDMSGNGTYAGNVTAYSDERLKKDWSPIYDGFVDRLAVIRAGTYTRIDSGERQAGVSAQAMRELLPEVVSEDNEGTLALAYGNAAMVSAVELAKELVALKNEVAELRARIH